MFQSVMGPLQGFYIATYACPVGEFGERYVGYFKVFRDRPRCYCDEGHIAAQMHAAQHLSPEVAAHEAALQGLAAINSLAA